MGDDLYTSYWKNKLPSIIQQFIEGKTFVQLQVNGLEKYGKRKNYYSRSRITNGMLVDPKNAQAQGRDLFKVLSGDKYFQDHLTSSDLELIISQDLMLSIAVLLDNAPDFFNKEDFHELSRFAGLKKDNNSADHSEVYTFLQSAYRKTAYWAKQVQKEAFPEGKYQILVRPTNRNNNFENYQWAKIYPDQKTFEYKILAFTLGFDTEERFTIKIDTVGLDEKEKRRVAYLKLRGEFTNSPIVKHISASDILDKGWGNLIDISTKYVRSLKPSYDSLLRSLNIVEPELLHTEKEDNMISLNTILYGPPGTGKTYHTINKAVAIANPKFDIKSASRTELKIEFERLRKENQIVFTTFHQSMSYEDFIEGIKPDLEGDDADISYRVKDGILKTMSILAAQKTAVEDNFETVYQKLMQEIEENDGALILKTISRGREFTIYENSKGNLRLHANTEKANEAVLRKNTVLTYLQTGVLEDWPSYTKAVGEYLKLKYGYSNEKRSVNRNYVLIIDEINRGNVSQIFGELITLLEEDKRIGKPEALEVILPYSKKPFSLPPNLYIIGTMNTADRSVEALDTALRRRFEFEEMHPKSDLLSPQRIVWELWWRHPEEYWHDEPYATDEKMVYEFLGIPPTFGHDDKAWGEMKDRQDPGQIELLKNMPISGAGINLQQLLETINKRLFALLGKDHTLGHAWLMNVYNLQALQTAFKNKILPLLQEFFYSDYSKIGLVLGNAFVKQEKVAKATFADFKDENEVTLEYENKVLFTLVDPTELRLNDFISIYK